MASTTLLTSAGPFLKVRGVNQLDNDFSSAFPSKIPTTTEPPTAIITTSSGHQAINIADGSFGTGQNSAVIIPYCTGVATDAFSMRIIGWRSIGAAGVAKLWVPVILAECGIVVSTIVGVTGAALLGTERFATGITVITGNYPISIENVPGAATGVSPTPLVGMIAHVVVALKGFQKVECTFDATTVTGAAGSVGMNALASFY